MLLPETGMTAWQMEFLGLINKEMGVHLKPYLAIMFERLLGACAEVHKDPTKIDRYRELCGEIYVQAITDETVVPFCDHCLTIIRDTSDDVGKVTCYNWLTTFCNGITNGDCLVDSENLEEKAVALIRQCCASYMAKDRNTVHAAVGALNSIVACFDKDTLPMYIEVAYNTIKDSSTHPVTHERLSSIPGFNVSGGLTPLWTLYKAALKNGDLDQKVQAANLFGEIIILSQEIDKKEVKAATGPLIKAAGTRLTAGDSSGRLGSSFQVATLETFILLLRNEPLKVKSFAPQLTSTFQKLLLDVSKEVRDAAVNALKEIMRIHSRVDNVVVGLTKKLDDKINNSGDLPLCISLFTRSCYIVKCLWS